jgi:hypothetical protein
MGIPDHKTKGAKKEAKLIRSRTYRDNGYRTIKGNGGKKRRYADLERIQGVLHERGTTPTPKKDGLGRPIEPASVAHARRYTFTSGKNFKIGGSPYANEAHHMLPVEAFGDKYFTAEQKEVLERIKYDVNNGKNIIFLPESDRDCEFHNLPQHNGSHPDYTALVDGDMQNVRTDVDKVLAEDPEHKNYSVQDMKKRFMDLQDQYWGHLASCGQIKVNEFKKPKPKGLAKRK